VADYRIQHGYQPSPVPAVRSSYSSAAGSSGYGYVPGAHPACREGCQMKTAQEIADTSAMILSQMGRSSMSAAMWCDQGGHAFSERDPGRRRITMNVLDEETGREITDTRDVCGGCVTASGLDKKKVTRPAVTGSAEPVDDRD
jgi:hypothetical protein